MRGRTTSAVLALLALLMLAGCAQDAPAATPTQPALPTVAVTQPADPTTAALPTEAASPTEAAGDWTTEELYTGWRIAYPAGWSVNNPGEFGFTFSGPYGGYQYALNVYYPIFNPTQPDPTSVAEWVEQELALLTPDHRVGAQITDVMVDGVPGQKVLNLLIGKGITAHRVYVWESTAANPNRHYITLTQTDSQPFDAAAAEALLDQVLAQLEIVE